MFIVKLTDCCSQHSSLKPYVMGHNKQYHQSQHHHQQQQHAKHKTLNETILITSKQTTVLPTCSESDAFDVQARNQKPWNNAGRKEN
jgi:hypothetical protein